MLLLDMLYGLCQLLGIVAPRRINLKLHQISFFNTKAVGCRSWRALTSAINVQFAYYKNNCVHEGDLHVCIK